MGKYMKKSKISGEVAVMEVAHHSSGLGVRTRARALALQRLNKPSDEEPDASAPESYLELRSRRLEKVLPSPPKPREARAAPASSGSRDEVEVSFGENVVEAEARDRSARETTPCSLIRDSETIGTPSSTTRPTNSTSSSRRMQSTMHRSIPTAHEMEAFFAGAEQQQHRMFVEKYNFDLVDDLPLPGRYEWVKLDSGGQ